MFDVVSVCWQVFGRLIFNVPAPSAAEEWDKKDETDGMDVDNDLKEHMVSILFSRNKLSHLQKQVFGLKTLAPEICVWILCKMYFMWTKIWLQHDGKWCGTSVVNMILRLFTWNMGEEDIIVLRFVTMVFETKIFPYFC